MVCFHFKIHPVGKLITCTKFSKKRATLQWDQEVNTSPPSAAGKLWFGLMSKNAAYRPKVKTASLQSHKKYLHFSYIQCLSDSLPMTGAIWKIQHRWKRSFYPSKSHKVNLNHIFTTRAQHLYTHCGAALKCHTCIHSFADPSMFLSFIKLPLAQSLQPCFTSIAPWQTAEMEMLLAQSDST